MPQNLRWREVVSMLGAMADTAAVEDDRGHVRVTRNGRTLHMHRPRGKDFSGAKELMQVRHFLARSETPAAPPAKAGTHLLVVIDHREARIFSTELHGSVPQRITPYDPFGFGRALHYKQDDSNGQRKPERKSFYEAVARTLEGAKQILVFGTGTGASSAMEQLLAALERDHKELVLRVVGTSTVDEHHLTDDQLLAKARELFAAS
jgi:hypothetical protein